MSKMGSLGIIQGICLAMLLSETSGAMPVGADIAKTAEKMYDEKPYRGPTGDLTMRPVKDLTICLRRVFTSAGLKQKVTARPVTTDLPTIIISSNMYSISRTPSPCVYGDRSGNVIVLTKAQRERRSQQLKNEIKKFHNCICHMPPHGPHDHCDFNMLETDYNATVLEGCLKNKNMSEKAKLTYRSEEFHCHLRNDFAIRCHPKQSSLEAKDTTFLSILVCLSSALESIECDRSGRTYRHDLTTTKSPNVSTAKVPLKVKIVFLSMTVVLGLLLGILGTVCCVFCWRQRKKRSVPTTSIVKRTGPRVPQNTYEHRPQDNTIYEELPDTEVPDLLQQGPRSVLRSREDVSESVFVHSNLRSVTYKPGGQGYYEALARHAGEKEPGLPGTSKPVPAPRTTVQLPRRLSSGHNDYLDLEEGSKQPDGTQPSVSNPYFVLESSAATNPAAPEPPGGHTDGVHVTREDENTQDSSTTGRRDEGGEECSSKSSSMGGSDVGDYQKLQRPTLAPESQQEGGYECPVSPDFGFDLATTYNQSEEDRQTTCSPDYQRLTGTAVQQVPQDSVEAETKHDYFVLENQGKA